MMKTITGKTKRATVNTVAPLAATPTSVAGAQRGAERL